MAEAVFEPELLQSSLGMVADFCGAEIAHMMVADGHRTLLQSTFSEDQDAHLMENEPLLQDINPRVLAIPKMKVGRSTQDRHFISRDEIAKDTVYQELILPAGLGHFSAVPVVMGADLVAGIALHRPFDRDEFSEDTIRRHETAALACQPVFELSRLMGPAHARTATETLGPYYPALCMMRSGREVSRNHRMESVFKDRVLKTSTSGKVQFVNSESDQKLSAILSKRSGPVFGNFIVRDEVGSPIHTANVMPLPRLLICGELVGAVLLVLKPVGMAAGLDTELLRATYGFTRAEASVAELLGAGRSIAQISAIRSVSVHTTQTLVKRVLAKMGCRRQGEAISILTSFAL